LGYALSVAVQSVVSLEIVSSLGKKTPHERAGDHYIVCAVSSNDGEVVFNPGGARTLELGDVLIVLGNHDDLKGLEKTANASGVTHNTHYVRRA